MSADQFDERWRSRTRSSLFSGEGFEDPVFQETVNANLADGRFRLVLAVDEINSALKRMVEYVNAITSAETCVIAVEYIRYRHGDVEVLTPRTCGDELSQAKVARQVSTHSVWSHSDYRDWLTAHESTTLGIFDELTRALTTIPMTFRGGRGNSPSGTFIYESSECFEARPLQLSTIRSAILELNFADWVTSWKPSDGDRSLVEELMKQWSNIPELGGAMSQILSSDSTRRRSIPLASLTPAGISRIVLALGLLAESVEVLCTKCIESHPETGEISQNHAEGAIPFNDAIGRSTGRVETDVKNVPRRAFERCRYELEDSRMAIRESNPQALLETFPSLLLAYPNLSARAVLRTVGEGRRARN